MRVRGWILALLVLLPGAAWGQKKAPIVLQADACFAGMAPRGVFPLVVAIENHGGSADGALQVRSLSYTDSLRSYAYPVSLPAGTRKQIVVYPDLNGYTDQISVSFDGSARSQDIALSVPYRDGTQVGLIGDEVGALAMLRVPPASGPQGGPGRQAKFSDCYARPEDAPDRAVGYQELRALVLGDGTERLRPAQWAALRQWVMEGGSLVMLGGAGATYLRVPDAAPFLPVTGLHETVAANLTLPPLGPLPDLPPGAVAVTTGSPKPGATTLASQNGQVLMATQSLGAGTILFVAFNPLEKPFRGWPGQRGLWLGLLHQSAATVSAAALRDWTAQQQSFREEDDGPYTMGGPTSRIVSSGVNPFRIKLPPIKTIAWLFLAYFVLVIPVSYFVLKRLGRLEWAWVTSPVLSVLFAYAFYLFTAQLYQAGLSRRTAGVLVAVAGDPQARFDGFSEVFFPQGGRYKIDIPGTEALELTPFVNNEEDYGGNSPTQPLDTVDMGQVTAPGLNLGNLAFRRLYHTEPVGLGGAITTHLRWDTAGGGLAGTVHNGTAQTLTACGILLPDAHLYSRVGDLAPGQTATVGEVDSVSGSSPLAGLVPLPARVQNGVPARAFLTARTSGEGFGPAIGRDVGGPQSVALLVSVPLEDGRKHP